MNEPFDISSSGYLAQQLQVPVNRILTTVDQIGVPVFRLNGVPHFAAADVERIRQAVHGDDSRPLLKHAVKK